MLSSMEQHPVLTIVSVEISEDYNIRQDTRKQETWTIAKQLRLGGGMEVTQVSCFSYLCII